jgi:hypothetical protein
MMQPSTQRRTTIALVMLFIVAVAIRYYLNTRETFRFVDESMPFAITAADVVAFRSSHGLILKTNAELASAMRLAKGTSAVVKLRERMRGGNVVGWKVMEVGAPAR